jgi:hypothetical protein
MCQNGGEKCRAAEKNFPWNFLTHLDASRNILKHGEFPMTTLFARIAAAAGLTMLIGASAFAATTTVVKSHVRHMKNGKTVMVHSFTRTTKTMKPKMTIVHSYSRKTKNGKTVTVHAYTRHMPKMMMKK